MLIQTLFSAESERTIMERIDCYRVCLLCLSTEDALGRRSSWPPGTFAPVIGMGGGGPFGLKPGVDR